MAGEHERSREVCPQPVYGAVTARDARLTGGQYTTQLTYFLRQGQHLLHCRRVSSLHRSSQVPSTGQTAPSVPVLTPDHIVSSCPNTALSPPVTQAVLTPHSTVSTSDPSCPSTGPCPVCVHTPRHDVLTIRRPSSQRFAKMFLKLDHSFLFFFGRTAHVTICRNTRSRPFPVRAEHSR